MNTAKEVSILLSQLKCLGHGLFFKSFFFFEIIVDVWFCVICIGVSLSLFNGYEI
ncbi:hypothetical protein NC652_029864 [Populus alba x Populus x berolinensis]|nr:hypothetical protein NC652_029864 [Populus alba x Populus x berolinensis]